jgi:hypothetical protein
MGPTETPLEMVQPHVRQGEQTIADQLLLIGRLRRGGLPTEEAVVLLGQFRALQDEHLAHLQRMVDERDAGLRDAGGTLFVQLS